MDTLNTETEATLPKTDAEAFEAAFAEITDDTLKDEPAVQVKDTETRAEQVAERDAETSAVPDVEVEEGAPEASETPDELQVFRDQLAALQSKIDAKPESESTPEKTAVEEPKPVYTQEESEKIKRYYEDWPEVVAGEALIRRKEYTDLVNYVFDEVAKRYEPLIDFYQNSSSRNQYSDIVALVPDYDDVRDRTLDWIETQPMFLKKAYKDVTETGSPADIATLIGIFKKETGYAASASKPTAAKTLSAVPAAKLPSPAKADAVAALKVVKSGRSSVVEGQPDKLDFEGSFEEAVKKQRR